MLFSVWLYWSMNIPSGVFLMLLWSALDLTSRKLVTSCRQDPWGSKAYIGSQPDYGWYRKVKFCWPFKTFIWSLSPTRGVPEPIQHLNVAHSYMSKARNAVLLINARTTFKIFSEIMLCIVPQQPLNDQRLDESTLHCSMWKGKQNNNRA